MKKNYIIDSICKHIDSLDINDFMRGYLTALILPVLMNSDILDVYIVDEVDIPDFMKEKGENN